MDYSDLVETLRKQEPIDRHMKIPVKVFFLQVENETRRRPITGVVVGSEAERVLHDTEAFSIGITTKEGMQMFRLNEIRTFAVISNEEAPVAA